MEITVSLETAKRLKEKGFPQDCENNYFEISKGRIERWWSKNLQGCTLLCADPTAEEILERLPKVINKDGYLNLWYSTHEEDSGKAIVAYYTNMLNPPQNPPFKNTSLAEALASLYIWCVDNGYITAEVK